MSVRKAGFLLGDKASLDAALPPCLRKRRLRRSCRRMRGGRRSISGTAACNASTSFGATTASAGISAGRRVVCRDHALAARARGPSVPHAGTQRQALNEPLGASGSESRKKLRRATKWVGVPVRV